MRAVLTGLLACFVSATLSLAPAQPPTGVSRFGTCAVCHGDAAKDLQTSVHEAIEISCVQCHGGDASISSKKACVDHPGFLGVPKGKDVAERCGSCHSDLGMMRQYGLPTDQLALFKQSPHGKLLFEQNHPDAPTCTSCHAAHRTLRAADAKSLTHRARVPGTCAKCHADAEMMARHSLPSDVYDKYARSAHGRGLLEHGLLRLPHCGDCHGSHGAQPAGVKQVLNVCGHCHVATRDYFRESPHHAASQKGLMNECTTCHGYHETPSIAESKSTGWDAKVCTECHEPGSQDDPAVGVAARIGDLLSSLRTNIDETRELLDHARGEGIVITEEETYLNDARHTLIMTGPVSHTASLDRLDVLTQKGQGILARVRESVEVKTRRVRDRRYTATITCAVLVLVVVLLHVRLRRFQIAKASETGVEE